MSLLLENNTLQDYMFGPVTLWLFPTSPASDEGKILKCQSE